LRTLIVISGFRRRAITVLFSILLSALLRSLLNFWAWQFVVIDAWDELIGSVGEVEETFRKVHLREGERCFAASFTRQTKTLIDELWIDVLISTG
jgi:hypothetical protein